MSHGVLHLKAVGSAGTPYLLLAAKQPRVMQSRLCWRYCQTEPRNSEETESTMLSQGLAACRRESLHLRALCCHRRAAWGRNCAPVLLIQVTTFSTCRSAESEIGVESLADCSKCTRWVTLFASICKATTVTDKQFQPNVLLSSDFQLVATGMQTNFTQLLRIGCMTLLYFTCCMLEDLTFQKGRYAAYKAGSRAPVRGKVNTGAVR